MPPKKKVQKIFDDVALKYDLMNDLMSFGLHRLWKKQVVRLLDPNQYNNLLDLAGGSGDIGIAFINQGGKEAIIYDLNEKMLEVAKNKILNRYGTCNITIVHGDAQDISFEDYSFNRVSMSFGIRNVESIDKVLEESYRVLKFMGKFVCLEFNNLQNINCKYLYQYYYESWIPKLGKLIVGDDNPYQYLIDSIKAFPLKDEFCNKMSNVGFKNITTLNTLPAVATIYIGYKL